MIKSISIQNIALIEDLNIDFYNGLNIITGETGAGKSILLNAIGFILGEKIGSDTLRTGASKGSVEVLFDIVHNPRLKEILALSGVEVEEDTLIIRREVTEDSRSRSFVNLHSVTNANLKTFGEYLLDISGQHDHQSLLRSQTHIDLLDNFSNLQAQREELSSRVLKLRELKNRLEGLKSEEEDKKKSYEINHFAIEEIEKSQLKPKEDDELGKELEALSNFEKLNTTLEAAYRDLYGQDHSVIPTVEKIITELDKINHFDPDLEKSSSDLREGLYLFENVRDTLRTYKDGLDYSPERIEEINERLELLDDLKRKYGATIADLMAHKTKCEEDVLKYSHDNQLINQLSKEIEESQRDLRQLALSLSKARQKQAKLLESEIEKELKFLGMDKTLLKVEFRYVQDDNSFLKVSGKGVKIEEKGIDRVEFIFSANPGETPRPLNKIVSGGELSRVMLAIKTILTEMDEIDTLLFDEVDAGIGGETAFKVGKKITEIAKRRQVLCITHSPQIASQSEHHYLVEKLEQKGRTKTIIRKLDETTKVKEIARMLSGEELTEVSLQHAKELIDKG
ncbi:MAG TPA: DNA repair protein RecN [Spirochaetes bacterium]|nr:DNA repair protein RecN [Spirochaetota bacterium]